MNFLTFLNIPLNRSQDEGYIVFSALIYILVFLLIAFAIFAVVMTVIRFKKVDYKKYFILSALFLAPCFINFSEGPFNLLAFDYLARTLILVSVLMAMIGFIVSFFGKKE